MVSCLMGPYYKKGRYHILKNISARKFNRLQMAALMQSHHRHAEQDLY